ncbi:protein fuzzy homolog isoform X2 [Actinia tenebrosa]|uniref:Protein fuzzy homolog isoform X2 n=1 Tax=Actinia tenebrosa TaxID=6105 RepID=A0A6P8HX71_ACTTE|nr:protein fuzzy homolog isoform X2 [Actinia tenebrosa]
MDALSSFIKSLDACAWRQSKMAAYLLCLTTDGGIPLFTRTKGDLPQLPFPVVGSLNGVHMFAKNQDVSLLKTMTNDATVVWKVFHDSITLIIVASDDNSSDAHLNRVLNLVFNAMVMLLGIDELTNTRNIELIKREMRCCYSLIDNILEGTDLVGDITQAVDVILCPDVSVLQETLDAFVSALESEFGCLLVMGKVAVATVRWWELTGIETVLLSMLIHTQLPCSSRDLPVYLPYGSPKVPHRLVTFQILEGIEVCVICGPTPTLQDIEYKFLDQYWRPVIDILKSCLRSHPRNLPPAITIDSGILAFILVNTEERKCLTSVFPSGVMTGSESEGVTPAKRKSALISFYKSIVETLFPPVTELTDEKDDTPVSRDPHTNVPHEAMETYTCTDEYKCYAVRTATHQLFALFSKDVPMYAMGPVTSSTLKLLTKDHLV